MRNILLQHWNRYPKMEIQDLVKLIYQSEFGGGHLIKDGDESLRRLKAEYEARQWAAEAEGAEAVAEGAEAVAGGAEAAAEGAETVAEGVETAAEGAETAAGGAEAVAAVEAAEDQADGWRYQEPAGYGMCRVKLAALDLGLAPETLNRMFVRSAAEVRGSVDGLRQGLELLRGMCGAEDGIPIPRERAESYIRQYRAQGYPVVSHSSVYRKYYHPGYRIVNSMYGKYLNLFIKIDRLLNEKQGETVNVVVDGMSGSGKSTLARLLAGVYGCNVFHVDDFFLQPFQRTAERLRAPGGNVDYERFREQVICHLSDEQGVEYQVYDCGRRELAQRVTVPHNRLNVIEGSYSQHPYFGDYYDLRVFLEIDREEQAERVLRRNGEFMLRRFAEEWIPMENAYFEAFKIRENSDVVYN